MQRYPERLFLHRIINILSVERWWCWQNQAEFVVKRNNNDHDHDDDNEYSCCNDDNSCELCSNDQCDVTRWHWRTVGPSADHCWCGTGCARPSVVTDGRPWRRGRCRCRRAADGVPRVSQSADRDTSRLVNWLQQFDACTIPISLLCVQYFGPSQRRRAQRTQGYRYGQTGLTLTTCFVCW